MATWSCTMRRKCISKVPAKEKKATRKEVLMVKIINALKENNLPDSSKFYADDDLSLDDIKIKIYGVGELSFPLSDNVIEKLVNNSCKAHFGSRDKTILDENIRSTHEITSEKLCVSLDPKVLSHIMNRLRIDLGLDDKCTLFPHLHNMLIYSVGQFFDVHQDSEKIENMIGTLVIVLPNAHIGGDLIIEYGERKHIFSTEAIHPTNAKCIAFYSDCHHKVERIKDGNRIALTYNLVLKTENFVLPSLIVNEDLHKAIREYFELKEEEQKLIYFFNHSYTEHSLKWDLLKGEDRTNGRALRSATQQLGLVPHLALVEIREHWTADGYDKAEDLIKDEIDLSFWVDSNNKRVSFSNYIISKKDICYTKDTKLFEPYDKEYEDFTENSGGTMDYWYRRAAIVLWPESIKILMYFKLDYECAFEELYELCKTSGNEKQALEIVKQAIRCFQNLDDRLNSKKWITVGEIKNYCLKLFTIASYIDNSESAISLLLNIIWHVVSLDFAEQLANLQFKYGVQWCISLLDNLKAKSTCLFLYKIDLLVASFLKYKIDTSLVKLLLRVQIEVLKKRMTQGEETIWWIEIREIHDFFKACLICKDYSFIPELIHYVALNPQQCPLEILTNLYVELIENIQCDERAQFKELKTYLTKTVDDKIISNMKSKENWSINTKLICSCVKCALATIFLKSKTQKTKVWPLPEIHLDHVIECLNSSTLPVKCSVEKTGSQFKLLLSKTDELHRDISKNLEELKLCQEKLRILND